MSRLIYFVFVDWRCESRRVSENYKIKHPFSWRDSNRLSLAFQTGALTDSAFGSFSTRNSVKLKLVINVMQFQNKKVGFPFLL